MSKTPITTRDEFLSLLFRPIESDWRCGDVTSKKFINNFNKVFSYFELYTFMHTDGIYGTVDGREITHREITTALEDLLSTKESLKLLYKLLTNKDSSFYYSKNHILRNLQSILFLLVLDASYVKMELTAMYTQMDEILRKSFTLDKHRDIIYDSELHGNHLYITSAMRWENMRLFYEKELTIIQYLMHHTVINLGYSSYVFPSQPLDSNPYYHLLNIAAFVTIFPENTEETHARLFLTMLSAFDTLGLLLSPIYNTANDKTETTYIIHSYFEQNDIEKIFLEIMSGEDDNKPYVEYIHAWATDLSAVTTEKVTKKKATRKAKVVSEETK